MVRNAHHERRNPFVRSLSKDNGLANPSISPFVLSLSKDNGLATAAKFPFMVRRTHHERKPLNDHAIFSPWVAARLRWYYAYSITLTFGQGQPCSTAKYYLPHRDAFENLPPDRRPFAYIRRSRDTLKLSTESILQ